LTSSPQAKGLSVDDDLSYAERIGGGTKGSPWRASEQQRASERYPALEAKSGMGGWSPLPGQGEPYADCGQKRYRGCLNVAEHPAGLNGRPPGMAYLEIYPRSCFRAQCPTCFNNWIRREAARAEHRLRSCKTKERPIHVVVSPPRKDWTQQVEAMRVKAYKMAKRAGFWGGCCVPHLLRKGRFSPHFHMLGYGWITRTPEVYRSTGWLVKNLRLRKSLGKTLRYELGHAAVHQQGKRHVLTWFGSLAYSRFKAPPIEEEEPHCPLCMMPLVRLLWIGELGAPEPPQEIGFEGYVDPNGWFEQGGGW